MRPAGLLDPASVYIHYSFKLNTSLDNNNLLIVFGSGQLCLVGPLQKSALGPQTYAHKEQKEPVLIQEAVQMLWG